MSKHSVAEARNNLSRLIERAVKGDRVVITRHGHAVVELKAIGESGRPVTDADIAWLRAHRVGRRQPRVNAAQLVSRVRDDEWR